MIGTATPSVSPDTFTLTVPKADVSLNQIAINQMRVLENDDNRNVLK